VGALQEVVEEHDELARVLGGNRSRLRSVTPTRVFVERIHT